jgi:cold shock CspA family protein
LYATRENLEERRTMKGTIIKAFRGYGFIQGEDGNTYHYKPVYEVGDQVEFEPSENEKGHEALNVRKEKEDGKRAGD